MSTLDTELDLPVRGNKGKNGKYKVNLMMFMKPNKDKEFYRFRLIKEKGQFPFVERHIHDHWAVNDRGVKLPDDTVVCPATKDEDARHNPELGFTEIFRNLSNSGEKITWDKVCPMCHHANENFMQWKASGYKDPVSRDKFNAMKRKSQWIVPIYVVNDPNYDKNNGRLRCFMFTEKDDYDRFMDVVTTEIESAKKSKINGNPYSIWNGGPGKDLCIRMDEVPTTVHPGEANEYTYNAKKITWIKFHPTVYSIDKITQELMDTFTFDEEYRKTSTIEDINEFYKKHYSTTADIPDDDVDMFDDDATPSVTEKSVDTSNRAVKPSEEVSDDVLEDAVSDVDETHDSAVKTEEKTKIDETLPSDESLDDVLDGMEDMPF